MMIYRDGARRKIVSSYRAYVSQNHVTVHVLDNGEEISDWELTRMVRDSVEHLRIGRVRHGLTQKVA